MSDRRHTFVAEFNTGDDVPDWLASLEEVAPSQSGPPSMRFSQNVSVFESVDTFFVIPTDLSSPSVTIRAPGEDRHFKMAAPAGKAVVIPHKFQVLGKADED